MSDKYKYETDGAARAEYSAFAEAKQEAVERAKELNQISELKTRIAELEQELKSHKLIFVGYTNGNQIEYAKDEEGSFYPDTIDECFIPLYMLKIHEHRIKTTKKG